MRLSTTLLAAAVIAAAVSTVTAARNLPDLGAARPIDLHDAVSGEALAPALRGKVVLLSFIAAACRESCQVIESKFEAAQTKLQRDGYLGSRVQLVLVGVDPIEDTPGRLRAIAARVHAMRGAFRFATGSAREVGHILKAYGIAVNFHNGSHLDPDHTVAIYLIDPAWRIRYDYAMFYPPDVIARLAEQLARRSEK